MKVKTISNFMLGLSLAASSVMLSGCVEKKYEDNAKLKAAKYLTGDQLLKAERMSRMQNGTSWHALPVTEYWDSLLTEAKVKRAYLEGQQLIKDSADGKFFRKPKLSVNFDTIITETCLDERLKSESASMVSAEEFINCRNNEPKYYSSAAIVLENPNVVHYWNYITEKYRIHEAFKDGMKAERKIVNNK